MDHYGYDSTKEMSRYKHQEKILKNYSAVETEYGAIEISVWDQDKQLQPVILPIILSPPSTNIIKRMMLQVGNDRNI